MSPDTPPKPSAAPERRRGPLGQAQVRVRDEWLDEDAPGTMAAWAEYQAEVRRAASRARQHIKRQSEAAPEAPPQPDPRPVKPAPDAGSDVTRPRARRRPGPRGSTQVLIGEAWVSERAADAWDHYAQLRDLDAVAGVMEVARQQVDRWLAQYESKLGVHRDSATPAPDPEQDLPSGRFDSEHKPKPPTWDNHLSPEIRARRRTAEEPEGTAEASEPAAPASVPEPEPEPPTPERTVAAAPASGAGAVQRQVVDIAYATGYAVAILGMVARWPEDEVMSSAISAEARQAMELLEALR